MMLAMLDGTRTGPSPHAHHQGHAECPHCRGEVVAKCGTVNVWHWAHKSRDCDSWAEPDTVWHASWQAMFPADWREITLGEHRADIRCPDGLVVEFQHSGLSAVEIAQREAHYGRMVWVFDAVEAHATDRLNLRHATVGKPGCGRSATYGTSEDRYRSFRWKHPRRSILHCQRPVYLDIGDGHLLELKKMYPNAPYGGWGYLTATDTFLQRCGLQPAFAH